MNLPVMKIAFDALTRNKVRSALTMLGIIIGVASVIAMVSLGQGAQKQVQDQISSMGTNLLIVSAGSQRGAGGVRAGGGTASTITLEDVDAIRQAPAVSAVSPGVTASVTLVAGNQNWTTRAEGVAPSYPAIRNRAVAAGAFFSDSDVRSAARVAVIGRTVADQLMLGSEAVGQMIRLRNLPFRIVGVLEAKGQSSFGQDQDDTVLIPYTTAMKKLLSTTYVPTVYVSAIDAKATSQAESQTNEVLNQRHSNHKGQDPDFNVRNLTDVADAAESTTRVMTLLLGGIAGVSLLVGGIGIMNIMIVSVTERTREIGIRKAIGARKSDIRAQFLFEAVTLSGIGGICGVLIGGAISLTIRALVSIPATVSPFWVFMGVAISVGVGLFFGYYPANRAANLDPIVCLRYE
jgi:putative ABC transport system permease protein